MSELTFGYTAFAREDQDDAARRQPACSLADWAQSRGLEYRGQELPGAFASVLPEWPEHLMNVCKGTFPGGRYGAVAHRLFELETLEGEIRLAGSYWGSRFSTHRSWKSMLSLGVDENKGPFEGNRAFAPTTTVVVRVPEAALFPRFLFRSEGRLPFTGNPRLGDFGMNHLRFSNSRWVDDELLAQLATAVAPVLANLQDPFTQFEYSHGAISLTVNGYRCDPVQLNYLVDSAAWLADALAAAAEARYPHAQILDFEGHWGAYNRETHPPGYPMHGSEWEDGYNRAAADRQMTREDPVSYHLHLPHCPIPGVADGVLRGHLPGTTEPVPVRLAWHVQGGSASGWVRGAAIFPVPPTVAESPVGGVLEPTSDMYIEVRDGLAHVWVRARVHGRLDSGPLLATVADLHARMVGG